MSHSYNSGKMNLKQFVGKTYADLINYVNRNNIKYPICVEAYNNKRYCKNGVDFNPDVMENRIIYIELSGKEINDFDSNNIPGESIVEEVYYID